MAKTKKCRVCGGKMEETSDGVFTCPDCGNWTYVDKKPACCKSCGGNYPECTTSCSLVDD